MPKTGYKFNESSGKMTFKFNMTSDQLALAKRAYEYVEDPEEPFEVFFIKQALDRLSQRMEARYREENLVDVSEISDVEAEEDNSL